MTAGEGCDCGHVEDLHHPAGRCMVELPAFVADELPAWRCPCRHYTAAAGPWRWHEKSQTWAAVPPPLDELAVLRAVQSCTVGATVRAADLPRGA